MAYNEGMEGRERAKKRSRFARSEPAAMRITARDLAIIAWVGRYRMLSAAHIAALDGGSRQQVTRRLRLLYDHGYLDRPGAQLAMLLREGNAPLVHALAQKGARLLAEQHGTDPGRLEWTTKNKRAGERFIAHTLMIADVMVALEIACRDEGAPILIDHHDLLAAMPERTRTKRDPFYWRAHVNVDGERMAIGQYPDRVFSLVLPDNKTRLNFLLEADMGSMSIQAHSLSKTSIRRKLLSYHAGFRDKLHSKLWGFERMRVLFVTNSAKRAESMIAAAHRVTRGRMAGLFLFTDRAALCAQGPFAPIWRTAKGETVSLL